MYKIEIGNKTGEKREFECDGTANIYVLFRELNITDKESLKRFAEPEDISQEEVENALSAGIMFFG